MDGEDRYRHREAVSITAAFHLNLDLGLRAAFGTFTVQRTGMWLWLYRLSAWGTI